jgi:ribosomal protein S18 acetylase RimI-like enzyme
MQLSFLPGLARRGSRHASLVQLTTDEKRAGAQRFYERLGFVSTHEGMKLRLVE